MAWSQTPAPAPTPPAAPSAPATAPTTTEGGDPNAAPAAAPKGKLGEEITVTGSRIRRKDLTTPAPVAVIGEQQIAQAGRISLGEFLTQLPFTYNATNLQVNNGGYGATRVDLRGLGNQRTLVLLNGRRLVDVGTGSTYGSGPDLNTIPLAVVERIEVLKDGASAVYGSDAIAGVVNVITKRTYNGVEANSYFGLSSAGDGFAYSVDSTGGVSSENGSFMISMAYNSQSSIMAGDREWSKSQLDYDFTTGALIPQGSSTIPNTRFYNKPLPGQVGNATWQNLLSQNPGASSFTYDPTVPGSYRPYTSADTYNFQPSNYIQTPNTRLQAFSSGEYKLPTSYPTRAYYQAMFTQRGSAYQLAPDPLLIGPGIGGADVVYSKNNAFNPFGLDMIQLRQRMTGFGPRHQDDSATTVQVTAGLSGTISPINWVWDAGLTYGYTTWTSVNKGLIWTDRLQNAIGPSSADGKQCLDASGNVIAGCAPLDMFHGANAVNPAAANYLSPQLVSRVLNELTAVSVNTSGELPVQLLSDRPLGLAFGYEYAFQQGSDTPDALMAGFQVDSQNRAATAGQYYSNQAYGELSIPIANHMPFVEDLEASAALRFVDYNLFGTNWSYKFGLRYSPIRDATIRGTYSTAFRTPTVSELYTGAYDNFPTATDPCADLSHASDSRKAACQAGGVPPGGTGNTGETQQRTTNGGNPNLKPETAITATGGVVLEPRWVKNLSLTMDYYWIQVSDTVSTYGTQYILDQCYPSAGTPNPDFCKLVVRDPNGGGLNNVIDVNQNVGRTNTAGLDFAARYVIPTDFGRFGLAFDGTWVQYYNVTQAGGVVIPEKGVADGNVLAGGLGGLYPAFKGIFRAVWNASGYNAGTTVRYISSIKQCADPTGQSALSGVCYSNPTGLYRESGDYASFDLFAGYAFQNPAGTTSISVGVNNVTNAAPANIYMALAPNSDPTTYDYVGRYFFVKLGHKL